MRNTNDRTFRVDVDVRFHLRAGPTTPVRMEMDFDPLLRKVGVQGLIDPNSLVVKRRLNGRTKRYNVQFGDTLGWKNQGWIAWLADRSAAGGSWRLEFRLRRDDGRWRKTPYKPPVGVGDELYYNGPRWRPINIPGYHPFPVAVDWNGDGLVDIISHSHHTGSFRMPWEGMFFWRNIGTNHRPRFAPPIRMTANTPDDPEFLFTEDYFYADAFDWFGTGRSDLVTVSRPGGIRVYRNTGVLDRAGMPKLELAVAMERPNCLAPGRYTCLRVVDWDSSGRPSIVLGTLHADKPNFVFLEQMVLMRNVGGQKGRWKFEAFPLPLAGGRTQPEINRSADWRTYSNFSQERALNFDLFDIDGDGKLELLFCHVHNLKSPVIEVWRNVGTIDRPAFMNEGVLPWSFSFTGFAFRFVRNRAFDGCLVSSFAGGEGIHYFRRRGKDPFDPKSFRDAGPLSGEGCKLKLNGYVRPFPVDLGRGQKMNLLCGDEPGFITWTENAGTVRNPAFRLPVNLRDRAGNVVRLNRERLLPDNNGERNCGQLKPCVCDWDRNGRLDLIVGNNTNRLLWLEGYDPKRNTVRKMHRLRVRGLPDPFAARKGPAVVDFDDDGRPELLAVDNQRRICLFRQGKGTEERLVLQPPIPFCFEDGKPITTYDIGPEQYKEPNVCLAACDWRGTGRYDLIVSSNLRTFFLENTGTNRKPKFKRPVPFASPDGVPLETSHHESHVAVYDWDGDGRPDLMIGGEAGTIYLFHRDWLSGIENTVRIRRES